MLPKLENIYINNTPIKHVLMKSSDTAIFLSGPSQLTCKIKYRRKSQNIKIRSQGPQIILGIGSIFKIGQSLYLDNWSNNHMHACCQ